MISVLRNFWDLLYCPIYGLVNVSYSLETKAYFVVTECSCMYVYSVSFCVILMFKSSIILLIIFSACSISYWEKSVKISTCLWICHFVILILSLFAVYFLKLNYLVHGNLDCCIDCLDCCLDPFIIICLCLSLVSLHPLKSTLFHIAIPLNILLVNVGIFSSVFFPLSFSDPLCFSVSLISNPFQQSLSLNLDVYLSII